MKEYEKIIKILFLECVKRGDISNASLIKNDL
jgi:hypothetical protein